MCEREGIKVCDGNSDGVCGNGLDDVCGTEDVTACDRKGDGDRRGVVLSWIPETTAPDKSEEATNGIFMAEV